MTVGAPKSGRRLERAAPRQALLNGSVALSSGYRSILSVIAVVSLYSFAASYALHEGLSIKPLYVAFILAAAAIPVTLYRRMNLLLRCRFAVWAWFYSTMLIAWLLFSSRSGSPKAYQTLESYGLGIITILVVYVINVDRTALRYGRRAVVAVVLVASILNLYEVFHPGVFSRDPGRSAGLYVNPTISGSALVLGLALTRNQLAGWRQAAYSWLVGLGVLATLSRAAIAGWVLVIGLGMAVDRLSARRFVAVAFVAAVGLAVATLAVPQWEYSLPPIPGVVHTRSARLGVLLEKSAGEDFSANERLKVARDAWTLFSEHPLLGAGLGATEVWGDRVSTHDLYLTHLAEFGILGSILLPGLAWVLLSGTWGGDRKTLMLVASYVMFACLFSHNVLDEWEFTVGIGMAAALATLSRQEGRTDR